MEVGPRLLKYTTDSVTDIMHEVMNAPNIDKYGGFAAAMGGTSLALVRLAHHLGVDKAELKHRICEDIDRIYASEDAIDAEDGQ